MELLNRFSALGLLLVFGLAAPADPPRVRPLAWAQPVLGTDVDNFHRVDDKVYRCAQPDDDEMRELEAMGIANVLNLRSLHSDEDDAEGTSLRLFHVPAEADDISAAQIEEALAIIHRAEGPVAVHCWHGSDRTGAVIAGYRMVFQDWTAEEAWDEALNGGYGLHGLWEDSIRRAIFSLDTQAIRARLGVTLEEQETETTPADVSGERTG